MLAVALRGLHVQRNGFVTTAEIQTLRQLLGRGKSGDYDQSLPNSYTHFVLRSEGAMWFQGFLYGLCFG
jgi:hypothetical protein